MHALCTGVQEPYDLPENVSPIVDADHDSLFNKLNARREPMIKLHRLTDEVFSKEF